MRASKALAASLASQPSEPAKRSKYGAKKTEVDGIKFASRREAARYGTLKLMERAGEIRDLVLQPKYPLSVNGRIVFRYTADFSYRYQTPLGEHDAVVVEDVKGFKTREYIVVSRLFHAIHGFPIKEV
jgi:hypothetical protein